MFVENPKKNIEYIEKLSKVNVPVVCLINKIDLADQQKVEELQEFWKETCQMRRFMQFQL